MSGINLGNVVGLLVSNTAPTKKYVIWAKPNPDNDEDYTLFKYDAIGSEWKPYDVDRSYFLPAVIALDTNTLPSSPSFEDAYLIGDTPTGVAVGHAQEHALWNGYSWIFIEPKEGASCRSKTDLNATYVFNSGAWVLSSITVTGYIPTTGTVVGYDISGDLITEDSTLIKFGRDFTATGGSQGSWFQVQHGGGSGAIGMYSKGLGLGFTAGITVNYSGNVFLDAYNSTITANNQLKLYSNAGDLWLSSATDIIMFGKNLKLPTRTTADRSTGNGYVAYNTDTNKYEGYIGGTWKDFVLGSDALPISGGTLTGFLTLHADPTNAMHAATKGYVDNAITGLNWKYAVRVGTISNITLSGTQTIDTVTVSVGDRVLVKNQSTATQNGIYLVSAGAWTRTTDADTGAEIVTAAVLITAGTQANTQWTCTNSTPPTLGSTAITFGQIAGAGVYTNGTGISLSGNAFSISNTYVGQTSITTLGTIGTGVWQGTSIADAYIASAATWNGKLSGTLTNTYVPISNGAGGLIDSNMLFSSANNRLYIPTVSSTASVGLGGTIGSPLIDLRIQGASCFLKTTSDLYIQGQGVYLESTYASLLKNTTHNTFMGVQQDGYAITYSNTQIFSSAGGTTQYARLTSSGFALGTAAINALTQLDLQATDKGLGLNLVAGDLGTTRNGLIWYDTVGNLFKGVANGVVVGKSYTLGTASQFVKADGSIDSNNYQGTNTTEVTTSATTLTLTASSNSVIRFTGSLTQLVIMPDATTLSLSRTFTFVNDSSATVTIQRNGGSALMTLTAGATGYVTVNNIATSTGTYYGRQSDFFGTNTWTWGRGFLNFQISHVSGTNGALFTHYNEGTTGQNTAFYRYRNNDTTTTSVPSAVWSCDSNGTAYNIDRPFFHFRANDIQSGGNGSFVTIYQNRVRIHSDLVVGDGGTLSTTAAPNATTSIDMKSVTKGLGLNLVAGDLGTTRNGLLWYDTISHQPKMVINGVVTNLLGGGGSGIATNGTSVTTAAIPFAEGITIANNKLIKSSTANGNLYITNNSTAGTDAWVALTNSLTQINAGNGTVQFGGIQITSGTAQMWHTKSAGINSGIVFTDDTVSVKAKSSTLDMTDDGVNGSFSLGLTGGVKVSASWGGTGYSLSHTYTDGSGFSVGSGAGGSSMSAVLSGNGLLINNGTGAVNGNNMRLVFSGTSMRFNATGSIGIGTDPTVAPSASCSLDLQSSTLSLGLNRVSANPSATRAGQILWSTVRGRFEGSNGTSFIGLNPRKSFNVEFKRAGALSYSIIQIDQTDSPFSNPIGYLIQESCTLEDISVLLGTSSASGSGTLTFIVKKLSVGIGNTGTGSQISLGGGTTVGSVNLVSTGTLSTSYYRNNVSINQALSLAAGDIIWVETNNFTSWSATDVLVNLRFEKDIL